PARSARRGGRRRARPTVCAGARAGLRRQAGRTAGRPRGPAARQRFAAVMLRTYCAVVARPVSSTSTYAAEPFLPPAIFGPFRSRRRAFSPSPIAVVCGPQMRAAAVPLLSTDTWTTLFAGTQIL